MSTLHNQSIPQNRRRRVLLASAWAGVLLAVAGCGSQTERVELARDNQQFREQVGRLERSVAQRDATIAQLQGQVRQLQQVTPGQSLAAFAPVRIKIASLSGGVNLDGRPGDDAVRLYVQPIDADGDVVKVPGRLRVLLVDDSELSQPRTLGVYVFDSVEELGEMWHGRFLTQHFTVECPFPPGARLGAARELLATVEFVDVLSGATLRASERVPVAFASR